MPQPRCRAVASLLAAVGLAATATAAPLAYVTISDESSVAVIDTASGTEVTRIAIVDVGSAFAVHPSGRRVFVSAHHGVAEIDALTNTAARVINLGIKPAGVAVSPAGDRLYVVDNAPEGAVKVLDVDSGVVLSTVGVGNSPSAIAVSPDGLTAYVTNTRDFTEHPPCSMNPLADCPPVSVIDTALSQERGRLNVGINPSAVAVDPATRRLLVAHLSPDAATLSLYAALAIFDPGTFLTQQVRLNIGTYPEPAGLAAQPAARRAYVSGAGGVSVVDIDLAKEVAFVPVGSGDLDGVAFDDGGTRAFVVDVSGEALAVVDTTTLSVISTIPVRGVPHAVGRFVGPGSPPSSPTPGGGPTLTPTWFFPACCLSMTCPRLCGPTPLPTETPPLTPVLRTATPAVCAGDCNGDAVVTVDELVTMVNIALGIAPVNVCSAGDTNSDSGITIDEIIGAVNNALSGCGG